MSYDITLKINTGNDLVSVTEYLHPTYNLARMFSKALEAGGIPGGMRDTNGRTCLDGMHAKRAIPILEAALKDMRAKPDTYRKLDSPNGWGDYDGAVRTFERLLEMCREHPACAVYV